MVDQFPNPNSAYETVSTVLRVVEKKGFVDHKAYGGTYAYFQLITKCNILNCSLPTRSTTISMDPSQKCLPTLPNTGISIQYRCMGQTPDSE